MTGMVIFKLKLKNLKKFQKINTNVIKNKFKSL